MKKVLGILITLLLICGCSMNVDMENTPTKQVEAYLNNYQTLDQDVLNSLDNIVNKETTFNDEEKEKYRDILKKHYQDLNYIIKEETINGDRATVEAEIEVTDYTKVLKDVETHRNDNMATSTSDDINTSTSDTDFNNYKLEQLEGTKDKVKYTIYFSLSKVGDKWKIDDLTQTEQEKILGIYEY